MAPQKRSKCAPSTQAFLRPQICLRVSPRRSAFALGGGRAMLDSAVAPAFVGWPCLSDVIRILSQIAQGDPLSSKRLRPPVYGGLQHSRSPNWHSSPGTYCRPLRSCLRRTPDDPACNNSVSLAVHDTRFLAEAGCWRINRRSLPKCWLDSGRI